MSEARTCEPDAPARVCSMTGPDYGHVLRVGDAKLLPGECALIDAEGRAGLVRVDARDPRGAVRGRWIRAPRSKVTLVELGADGRASVADHLRCDRSPIDLEPAAAD